MYLIVFISIYAQLILCTHAYPTHPSHYRKASSFNTIPSWKDKPRMKDEAISDQKDLSCDETLPRTCSLSSGQLQAVEATVQSSKDIHERDLKSTMSNNFLIARATIHPTSNQPQNDNGRRSGYMLQPHAPPGFPRPVYGPRVHPAPPQGPQNNPARG